MWKTNYMFLFYNLICQPKLHPKSIGNKKECMRTCQPFLLERKLLPAFFPDICQSLELGGHNKKKLGKRAQKGKKLDLLSLLERKVVV